MSYAMEKINVHERKAGEHEERLQRLEENSSNNVLIFDDIDRRLVKWVRDQQMGHLKWMT